MQLRDDKAHVFAIGNAVPVNLAYEIAIFDLLKQEKNYGTKWSEIADKSQKVYIPLLQAFIDEINRANGNQ